MDISALFNLGSPPNHATAANPTYQALSSNSTYSNSGNPIFNGHYQPRTYLLEGFVTFIKGNIRQRRYLFLFDDWLIIVKSKPNNAFQIKKKVRVAEIWVSDQIQSIHRFTKSENVMEETQKSFVIGWPLINFVVTFESIDSRNIWWCHLSNAIKIQVEREEPPLTPLKIFNWNLQCPIKAKTINITANQTGEECLKKSTALFHPQESQQQETQENNPFNSSIINSVQTPPDITLWVTIKSTEHLKVSGNNLLHHDFLDTAAPTSSVTNHHHIQLGLREATPAPVKLVGFERPYAIIMNYMRQECVNAATGTQPPQSQLAKHGPINFFGATTQSSGGIYGTLSGNSQTVENIYANPSSPTSRLSSACSSHRPIDKTTSNSSSSFSLADTSIYPPSSSTSLAMKPDCSLYGNVGCNTQPSKLHLQQLLEGNMSTMLCQFSLRINAHHKAKHDNQNHQATFLGSNNNKRLSQKIKETKLIPKHKNGIYNIRRSHNKMGFAIRQPLSDKEFPQNGHDPAEKSNSHSLAPCQTVDGKGGVKGPAKNKRGVEKSPCSKSLSLNTFGIKRSHHENDDQGKFKASSPTRGGKYTPLNMKKHTAESPFACVTASKKGGHSDVLSLGSDSSFLNNIHPSGHYSVKADAPFLQGAKRSNVLYNRPLNELFLASNNEFPKPIKKMLQLLYTYGPYTIGIFRKSSSAKLCKTIREQLDAGVEVKLDEVPMLAISSLYKEFLRNIPNGLMDSQLYRKWFQVTNTQNETEKFQTCKNLYNQLPKHNQLLLSHTLRIFKAIHDNCEYNSMTRTNLGICVGPSLLWEYSNDPTNARTSVSSIAMPNQNTIPTALGDAQSAKKKSKLLLNWRGACHNNSANLAAPLTKSTSSNTGFTAAMTSLLIKPSASKTNLFTVSDNRLKSNEDTPLGLESLADHENGTKWIPALIDYLITHIHAIDPTSLAHNSSFKIKFNSSKMRSNQRITTTAPLAHRASSKSSQSQSQRRALAQRLQAKNMSKRSTLNAIIYNDIGDVMKEATLLRKEEEEQQQRVAKLGQQCSTKALNTQIKYSPQSKIAFDISNPSDQHSKCYSNKIPLPVITVKSVGDDITEDSSKSVSSPGSAFSLPLSLTRRLATVSSEPKLITALNNTMNEATQKEEKRHFDDVFETFCDRSGSALTTPNDPLDPLSSATALNHDIKFVFSPTHSLSLSSLEKSDGLMFGADRRSGAPYLENNEEDEQNNCKYDEMCFDQNYLSPFRTITPLKFPSIRNLLSAEGPESKFDQRSQPSTSIISTSNGHINSCIGDSDSITNERDVYEVSSIESLAP